MEQTQTTKPNIYNITQKEISELDDQCERIYTKYEEVKGKNILLQEKLNKLDKEEDSEEIFKLRGEIAKYENQKNQLFEDFKNRFITLSDVIEYEILKQDVEIIIPHYHLTNQHLSDFKKFLKEKFPKFDVNRGNKTIVLGMKFDESEYQNWGGEDKKVEKKGEKFQDIPDNVKKIWIKNFEKKSNKLEIWVEVPFCYNSPLIMFKIKVSKFSSSDTQLDKSHSYDKIPEVIDPSEVENDKEFAKKVKKVFLNIDLSKVFYFTLEIKAINKMGPSENYANFKIIVPKSYPKIYYIGDNKLGQIEEDLILPEQQKLKESYFEGEHTNYDYIDQFIKVSVKNVVKTDDITVSYLTSKSSSLAVLNNWQIVQWGLTVTKDDKNEFSVGPSGLFTPCSMPKNPITVSRISLTLDSCCIISSLCKLYTWGMNQYGELGHNDTLPRVHPTLIDSTKKINFIDIKSGDYHYLALTDNGKAFNWGFRQAVYGSEIRDRYDNVISYESLGDNHQKSPNQISKGYTDDSDPIVKIRAGGSNNGFLSKEGKLYLWGDNSNFQVFDKKYSFPVTPVKQDEADKLRLRDFDVADNHGLFLDFKGELYFKGSNLENEVGNLNEKENYKSFTQVGVDFGNAIRVVAGDMASYVFNKKGEVFCAGRRLNGFKYLNHEEGWFRIDTSEFEGQIRNIQLGVNSMSLMVG